MPEMVFSGCICCYNALDFSDIKFCCEGEGENLCITQKACIAAGTPGLGVGAGATVMDATKGEVFAVALHCCKIGCKVPTVCVAGKSHVLCIKVFASFPFSEDFVPKPVCAVCFLQCAPAVGCAKPYGGAPAVDVTDAVLDQQIARD